MEEILTRFGIDLLGRLTGPLTMRLFLQPSVAGFFAVRDGLKDAREGRPYHFWRMVTGPPEARIRRAKETWRAVSKVFIMAVVLDVVYQWLALPSIYPVESMVTATILAIIPYVALRGVTNRIAHSRLARHAGRSKKVMALCLTTGLAVGSTDARAQDKPKEPPELGWSNSTDFSLVLTAGNSASLTWGFTDQLRHVWKDARFEFEVNVNRSNTSDKERFKPGTAFDNRFETNVNLSDSADYSVSTTSALSVSVVSHILLKVSLQWLYENEPALESDLDVIAFVEVLNPDGISSSGDERFRTLSSGGSKLVIGSADARKNRLDTIFKTALVLNF